MPAVSPVREFSLVITMKRLGLSRPLLAATLFLAAGLCAAEENASAAATTAQRAAERLRALPTEGAELATVQPTLAGSEGAVTAQGRDLVMRFDRNGDGRLDDAERSALRAELMRAPGGAERRQLDPAEAALVRKFLFEERGKAERAGPPETVAERLARRRAESLRRAEPSPGAVKP
jgi:hypothetical protein